MKTQCPQCKGQRRYYRPKQQPMPEPQIISVAGDTAMSEIAYERELVECARCDGTGSVDRTERVPVMQGGEQIGTVPPSFDPLKIKSMSFWYEPRAGDFILEGDVWVASRTLGPGDIEAVPGFVWERNER